MNQRHDTAQAMPLRPAGVCTALLAALDAAQGRRRRRQRDTTPDAIGLEVKRWLLDQAVMDDPGEDEFESWLMERCRRQDPAACALGGVSSGALRAMASDILDEWHMATSMPAFRRWLDEGAPSQDR